MVNDKVRENLVWFKVQAVEYEMELGLKVDDNYLTELAVRFTQSILHGWPISQNFWKLMRCMQDLYEEDYEFKMAFNRVEDILFEERGDVLEHLFYELDKRTDSEYSDELDQLYDDIFDYDNYKPTETEWEYLVMAFSTTNLQTREKIAEFLEIQYDKV